MLFFTITKRLLREVSRSKMTVIVLIGLPSFMGFMFWFAFSNTGLESATTYNIGVINNDEGIADSLVEYLQLIRDFIGIDIGMNDTTLENGFATDFIKILNETNYPIEDGQTAINIFDVREYNDTLLANKAVESRQIAALVIFDANHSNTTLSAIKIGRAHV